MSLKAVLFDLDGTLLDTAPDFRTALNRLLLEENKAELDEPRVRAMVSNGSANLVAQAFAIDHHHTEFEPLRRRLLDYYGQCMLDNTRLFPGMQDSIEVLTKHDVGWGIVTNKPEQFSQAIIKGLGLNPATLICPENAGKPKPDPAGILMGCAELKCLPVDCLYIGDHLRDINAGRAAGCKTMAATYGYLEAGDDATRWGADFILVDPAELPALLLEQLQ